VQKTFDFFRATATFERITQVVVSGGASRAEGVIDMLAERFDAPVEVFDPFRKVAYDAKKFNAAPETVGPMVAVAVGLALRRAGDR
jgi:type IV pilus assembly protein PilM